MNSNFVFVSIEGFKEKEIDADHVRLYLPDGEWVEMSMTSHGQVDIRTKTKMIIYPRASNTVHLSVDKW